MRLASDKLHTPIYVKTGDDFVWPENERVFYLLTSDGLFLCRNHPFFRSSARVEQFPAELARHEPWLKLNYPQIPRRLFEQVVGFFSIVGRRYGSEAAVLLAWNKTAQRIELVVPEQVGLVSQGWYGNVYPLELQYEIPPLPPNLMLIGDIHSHVDMAAYASGTDKADEEFRPGLHIVVGRIQSEPPEFHCEVTVDGARFRVRDFTTLIAGYKRRRESEVPEEWLAKLKVKSWNSAKGTYTLRQPVDIAGNETSGASLRASAPNGEPIAIRAGDPASDSSLPPPKNPSPPAP